MNVGELFVRLGLDNQSFRRALQSTENDVRGLGSTVGTVSNAVKMLVAGAGMVGSWNWLVKGNAQMEQYEQTLRIVLGSQEEAVRQLEWAQKFAAKTPFEIPDIVEATTRLAAYGINAQDVLGTVGDMAAAMGKPLMQAIEAMADAQTGELERLKEFGITKQMLIDKAAEMGKQEIVNAKGQITDMQGMNDALIAIMTERYSGAMEAQSTTLNGMISNLMDWFGTAGRILGADIFAGVKDNLQGVLDYLNKLTEPTLIEDMGKVVQGLSPLELAAQKVGIALDTVGSAIQWVKENSEILIPILAGVAAGFAAYGTKIAVVKALTLAQAGLNLVMSLNTFGMVVIAIAALVAAGVALYRNWDTVKAKASEAWNSIKTTVGETVESAKTKIIEMIEVGKNFVIGLWTGIQEKAEWLKQQVSDFIGGVVSTVKGVLGINSPSKVGMDIGGYFAQGIAIGIGDGKGQVATEADLIAAEMIKVKDRIQQLNREYAISVILQGETADASKALREEIALQAQAYDKLAAAAEKAGEAKAKASGGSHGKGAKYVPAHGPGGTAYSNRDGTYTVIGKDGSVNGSASKDEAKNKISKFANGGVITRPTIGLMGETGKARPEIVTPEHLMRTVFEDTLKQNKQFGDINVTINSPEPLNPSVIKRKQEQLMRQLALGW